MAKGNPKPKRHKETEFKEDNQAAVKHGGCGAIERLRKGQPFIGVALEVLENVIAETGLDPDTLSGTESILLRRAARFEATARMFDLAADSAASEGDLDKWVGYQEKSGWIGSKAFYAFIALRDKLDLSGGHVADYEEILANEQD